jgi:hypothetical protein
MSNESRCNVAWNEIPGFQTALSDYFSKNLLRLDGTPSYNVGMYSITDERRPCRSRVQVGHDIRHAILRASDTVPAYIRDENSTKDGKYVSNWIVLDKFAVQLCSMKAGGFGAIMTIKK